MDVHKAVKLADVGRRCIHNGDFDGVELLLEALFFEQGYRNIILDGVGVDCLLVGTICCRHISEARREFFFTTYQDSPYMDRERAPDCPNIQSPAEGAVLSANSLQEAAGGTDVSEEGKLDRCPLTVTKVR